MRISSRSFRDFISLGSLCFDADMAERLRTGCLQFGNSRRNVFIALDVGDHEGEEVEHGQEYLGVAEVELEHPGDDEPDRNGDADLSPFRVPSSGALPQKKRDEGDVGGERENAALGPQLDEIVVQMRDAEPRRVRLAIERIDLFHVAGADAEDGEVFDDFDAALEHADAVEVRRLLRV